MWRYTSISDLLNIIKAVSLSTLVVVSFILFGTRFEGFSRSVFIIDWCFTILLISGFRLSVRYYFEHFNNDESVITIKSALNPFSKTQANSKRLLIIGAGDCGEKIYREIRDNARLQYKVVGFLDDDLSKLGKKIHGVPVLSDIKNIGTTIKKVRADEALIAIPSASSLQMRAIVEV